jgi:hypothetical protein
VFVEPDWGHWQFLNLIICLNSPGARVIPTSRLMTLQKRGDTPPMFFDVVACLAGNLELYSSIYLAKEMTLLEEFLLTLPVAEARLRRVRLRSNRIRRPVSLSSSLSYGDSRHSSSVKSKFAHLQRLLRLGFIKSYPTRESHILESASRHQPIRHRPRQIAAGATEK